MPIFEMEVQELGDMTDTPPSSEARSRGHSPTAEAMGQGLNKGRKHQKSPVDEVR